MKKQGIKSKIQQAKIIPLRLKKPQNPFLDLIQDLEDINQMLDKHWKNNINPIADSGYSV